MSLPSLELDVRFALKPFLKEGCTEQEIEALFPRLKSEIQFLNQGKEKGLVGYADLLENRSLLTALEKTKKDFLNKFETVVVLGIGGSALGAKALFAALCGNYFNELDSSQRKGMKLFVCDQMDPDSFHQCLNSLSLEKTLFNVVSKSGSTLETLSQFLIVQQQLQRHLGAQWKEHVVITTDAQQGALCRLVKSQQLQSFAIPSNVGGRFSVFSTVGLLSAALVGIDLEALLEGARHMKARCQTEDFWKNPAALLAALHYLMYEKKKNMVVLWPYSDRLFPVAEWYTQLWAESIGKGFTREGKPCAVGSTPIAACGPRDQHSQLQLYQEGPADKFFIFLTLQHFEHPLSLQGTQTGPLDLNFLQSKTMADILTAEALATQEALREKSRPSVCLSLPASQAFHVGELVFLLEEMTALAAGLFGVNPFDQPGVEWGKKKTRELLEQGAPYPGS